MPTINGGGSVRHQKTSKKLQTQAYNRKIKTVNICAAPLRSEADCTMGVTQQPFLQRRALIYNFHFVSKMETGSEQFAQGHRPNLLILHSRALFKELSFYCLSESEP